MRFPRIFLAVATCAGLVACGDTTGEQAILGGGAGAVGAAVVSADPIFGAVIGAAGNVLYCKTQNTCR
ncbi:hypothetical protein [Ruegeria sp.]|uniref:hypothetical protein n=1 Tax=Ruegeria sp. TaxID=1879320 RepID=UPI003B58ED2E